MKTIQQIIRDGRTFLAQSPFVDNPETEIRWFSAYVLNIDVSELFLRDTSFIDNSVVHQIENLLQKRCEGIPLQYLLGSTEFYNTEIILEPGVFIPRPETEQLVELAIDCFRYSGEVLDICTGSGAVPCAFAKALPHHWPITGIDFSDQALRVAKKNAHRLRLEAVQFLKGDIFAPVRNHSFEIITANPPYISTEEFGMLPYSVKYFEPKDALHGGEDGLFVIRKILFNAKNFLIKGGSLLCEIGKNQGDEVQELFCKHGFSQVCCWQDHAGYDRIITGRYVR